MIQRVKLFIAALVAVFAISAVNASASQAYLHQSPNAYNACYELAAPTAEANFNTKGAHIGGSPTIIGWARYSDTDVWIDLRWIDNTVHWSIDTWCRLKGNDNGVGMNATYTSLGTAGINP